MPNAISLTKTERMELTKQATSRTGRAEDARRARLVLLLAEGHTWDDICDRLPCSRGFIDSWSKRFAAERVAGLYSRHRGQSATVLTPGLEARILEWTLKRKPADGSTQWSTRKLGAAMGVSHMMVSRVWAKHALKPHRIDGYLASNDPEFEAKAADVIGLYLNPPAHAAVFCVDEKTAIQALDRKDPVLAAVAGTCRTTRLRVLPPRHAVPVCRLQHQDRRGVGQDGRTAYVGGVRGVSHRHRGEPAAGQRDPRHCRQPFGAQDQARRCVSG